MKLKTQPSITANYKMNKKTKKYYRKFGRHNKTLKHKKYLHGGDVEREGIVDKIQNKIGSVIKKTGSVVLDRVANFAGYQPIVSHNNMAEKVQDNTNVIGNIVTDTVSNAVDNLTNNVTNTASSAIENVNEVLAAPEVQETIAEAAENTKEVAGVLLEKINEPFEDPMFKKELQEAAENVSEGAEIILKAADKPIDMAIEKVEDSLTKMGEAVGSSAIKITTDVLATLPPPIGTVVDIARMINDSTRAASSIVESGSKVVEAGSDLVIDTIDNIKEETEKMALMKNMMKEKSQIENRINDSVGNFQNPVPQYGGKKMTRRRLFKKNKLRNIGKHKSKRVRFAF
jgi:hypothetical protein